MRGYNEDIVDYWNSLTKVQLWSLAMGEVANLLDEAIEEIERLRKELSHDD